MWTAKIMQQTDLQMSHISTLSPQLSLSAPSHRHLQILPESWARHRSKSNDFMMEILMRIRQHHKNQWFGQWFGHSSALKIEWNACCPDLGFDDTAHQTCTSTTPKRNHHRRHQKTDFQIYSRFLASCWDLCVLLVPVQVWCISLSLSLSLPVRILCTYIYMYIYLYII